MRGVRRVRGVRGVHGGNTIHTRNVFQILQSMSIVETLFSAVAQCAFVTCALAVGTSNNVNNILFNTKTQQK